MTLINVGGIKVNPFSRDKTVKTIYDALNIAQSGDKIVLHQRKIVITRDVPIAASVRIESPLGTKIIMQHNDSNYGTTTMFALHRGDLQLKNIDILVQNQSHAICLQPGYRGSITLESVKIKYQHAYDDAEKYPLFAAAAVANDPTNHYNVSLQLTDSIIDSISLTIDKISIKNSELGSLLNNRSLLAVNNWFVSHAAFANISVYNLGSDVAQFHEFSTRGNVELLGLFKLDKFRYLPVVYESRKDRKTLLDKFSTDASVLIGLIVSSWGKDNKSATQVSIVDTDLLLSDDVQTFVDDNGLILRLLHVQGGDLIIKDSHITAFKEPDLIQGGSLKYENSSDLTPWVVRENPTIVVQQSETTLENNGSVAKNNQNSLERLQSLVGLADVKQQVQSLISTAQVEKARQKRGLKGKAPSAHLIFGGSPGTGKTTVAKLMGKLLYEQGVLPNQKFVYQSALKLLGKYQGHTPERVRELFVQAEGGVLFLDEAYALLPQGEGDSFKKEAIDEFTNEVSTHADTVTVIMAGYTHRMEDFIRKANPGLRSRFGTWVNFPNYSDKELLDIFKLNIGNLGFKPDSQATQEKLYKSLLNGFSHLTELQKQQIGNARLIDNVFDKLKSVMALRITKMGDISNLDDDELITYCEEDIQPVIDYLNDVISQTPDEEPDV